MAELKPCTLCGGEAEFIKLFESKRYDGFVRCTKCGNEGRCYTSKQNAAKAWNRVADAKNATITSPCIGCEIRKHFARAFDMHWHDGEDCPYECPKYDEWKENNK